MLKYGANPNFEIINTNIESFFLNSFPLLVAIRNDGNKCIETIKLLIEYGANIDCCYLNPMSQMCEGVIHECLTNNSMLLLRYFVIEKKIPLPNVVYIEGFNDKSTQKKFSLLQYLNLDDLKYKNTPSEAYIKSK
ncbi:hypothetical protein [Flavobacterium sp.]|uniref:hypothetical protein n=1 Tax=Flavobacterium sp. TaxID=239 RepID=UPI003750C306